MQYCCVTRGTYESGQSATRCDGEVKKSIEFFYQGVSTYQDCYNDAITDGCVDEPAAPPTVAVTNGPLTAVAPSDPLVRSFAIELPELHEGAYQLNVGTEATPDYVYCTGRGTLVTPTSCRVNSCDVTTDNFVTFEAVAPGLDCFHTCFHA